MRKRAPRPRGTAPAPAVEAALPSPSPRRVPQQERSRARVDAILKTTFRLVGEGRDVSMREIADVANVPIASIYQYFPDKTALLHAILVKFYARMRGRMEAALGYLTRIEDVPAFADAMLSALVLELRSPNALNVWSASQAQEVLRELDVREALALADLVSARLVPLLGGRQVDAEAARDLCVFAVTMAGPVVRQSLVMPPQEGERLLRELKTLIRIRATDLASGQRRG